MDHIGGRIEDTKDTIDRRNFEGATQVQVRVSPRNGLTQSVVTNEPFQLG